MGVPHELSSKFSQDSVHVAALNAPRLIQSFFFADVPNSDLLVESQMPNYYRTFYACLQQVSDLTGYKPVYTENWGSGLYCVFDTAHGCAMFGVQLIQVMKKVPWRKLHGLPENTNVRLGLHTGPVFTGYNPVMMAPCYFGAHVCRAARIKAVTPAGTIQASEQFVCALFHHYSCNPIDEFGTPLNVMPASFDGHKTGTDSPKKGKLSKRGKVVGDISGLGGKHVTHRMANYGSTSQLETARLSSRQLRIATLNALGLSSSLVDLRDAEEVIQGSEETEILEPETEPLDIPSDDSEHASDHDGEEETDDSFEGSDASDDHVTTTNAGDDSSIGTTSHGSHGHGQQGKKHRHGKRRDKHQGGKESRGHGHRISPHISDQAKQTRETQRGLSSAALFAASRSLDGLKAVRAQREQQQISEFQLLAQADLHRPLVCEFLGFKDLAKAYDTCLLFRLSLPRDIIADVTKSIKVPYVLDPDNVKRYMTSSGGGAGASGPGGSTGTFPSFAAIVGMAAQAAASSVTDTSFSNSSAHNAPFSSVSKNLGPNFDSVGRRSSIVALGSSTPTPPPMPVTQSQTTMSERGSIVGMKSTSEPSLESDLPYPGWSTFLKISERRLPLGPAGSSSSSSTSASTSASNALIVAGNTLLRDSRLGGNMGSALRSLATDFLSAADAASPITAASSLSALTSGALGLGRDALKSTGSISIHADARHIARRLSLTHPGVASSTFNPVRLPGTGPTEPLGPKDSENKVNPSASETALDATLQHLGMFLVRIPIWLGQGPVCTCFQCFPSPFIMSP